RLDTRLDTPPISVRHHPLSRIAHLATARADGQADAGGLQHVRNSDERCAQGDSARQRACSDSLSTAIAMELMSPRRSIGSMSI
ncbi:hypothetical protein, partial [Bradyrhizobium sp. Mp64]|uniref:hypothetical protein n=1 Tax=Bradyrhizobium sp. Mp64 TaxID=3042158 RepID=UPI00248AD563